ncbi:MAG: xanthine dehydrogenase family protein molybdopterin-binding subunit [Bacteroidetes bacterium]|nr:xanthine dehydrogenase family protein molybdopterin-binding subunit [Bacteroidota bacterium]
MNKWTRRAFITTGVLAGGAVVLGIAIRPGNRAGKVAPLIASKGDSVLNIWLKIGTNNILTVIIPHAEMGQGIHTTLAMMVADEMDADWNLVQFMEAPANKEYANYGIIRGFIAGEKEFPAFLEDTMTGVFLTAVKKMNIQFTVGSGSVRFTGMHAMRVAGAAARSMLLQAAAKRWSVPLGELTVSKSFVFHQASSRSASFAELAPSATNFTADAKPVLKKKGEYSIMGTSPHRFDIPQKVNGSAKYGLDTSLPGMKYATVKASPVFGNKVKSFDASAILKTPGILRVINLGDAVAIVADNFWLAKESIAELPIEFEQNNKQVQQNDIYEQYIRDLDAAVANGKMDNHFKSGDTEEAMKSASKTFEAEYRIPYLAHATMEPMNCTVWLHDGLCEIWCGSQNPLGFAGEAAEVLDMDIEKVLVHNQLLGGAFGRRAETDVVRQAALIAKEVNYPVKLIWTREEDMRHDMYREANISRMKAGLDKDGKPVAMTHQFLFKHHPPEAPDIPYNISNQLIHFATSKTHVPWGSWRSVDHSMHGFFIESFIDELAVASNQDPYQYRRTLLPEGSRFQKVLDLAAEKGKWGQPLPPNQGRGIAMHKSFGTLVAEVIDLEISDEGELKVLRVVCVADPGLAVHPDGFTAQMESGIIYGLTAALKGEITIENGAVAQSNFHDYPMVRMHEAPIIDTYIINSDQWPGGAGEPSTPCVAPAVTNAIYSLTGIRIRNLPVKNYDLSRDKWVKKDVELI